MQNCSCVLTRRKDRVGQLEYADGLDQIAFKSGSDPEPIFPVAPFTVIVYVPPRVAVDGLNEPVTESILLALALMVSATFLKAKLHPSKEVGFSRSGRLSKI